MSVLNGEIMLSKLSVKRPVTILLAGIVAVILGVISFMNMQTDLMPSMNLPYVVIYSASPGSNPEKIEQSVTGVLESAAAQTSGLKGCRACPWMVCLWLYWNSIPTPTWMRR